MNIQAYTSASARMHRIAYSDRLYARITMRGAVVAELTRDRFTSLSALMSTLRAMVPHAAGLCKLTVRNMTCGWHLERPLMLYPEGSLSHSFDI